MQDLMLSNKSQSHSICSTYKCFAPIDVCSRFFFKKTFVLHPSLGWIQMRLLFRKSPSGQKHKIQILSLASNHELQIPTDLSDFSHYRKCSCGQYQKPSTSRHNSKDFSRCVGVKFLSGLIDKHFAAMF